MNQDRGRTLDEVIADYAAEGNRQGLIDMRAKAVQWCAPPPTDLYPATSKQIRDLGEQTIAKIDRAIQRLELKGFG